MSEIENIVKSHRELSIRFLWDMSKILYDDTMRCAAMCKQQKDKVEQGNYDYNELLFWYRTLIRTFFAQVEGTIYIMRQNVVWAYERGEFKLSPAELSLLKEETYEFKDNKIKIREKYNTFYDNFSLAFKYFSKFFNPSFESNKSDQGRQMFRRLLDGRNSISHPKNFEDTVIPSEIIGSIDIPIRWFLESFRKCTIIDIYKTKF